MLVNLEVIKRSFDQVKDAVQASIQSERAREGTKIKGTYEEDHDVPMYGDGMKPQYAMPPHEVKKRRGRAAPPGRCHSCNRIDTPEWRRGPDGARTLCNACGLHYAKLERKRQLEARSIRSKPEDRS
ncbi:GATA-type sexual development transcription factor NsdD [Ophiocordyceps sinensis CO18]|nr:GATA-type sexual development transcription factor NsdD [Ophiocordyceps sinensis CO18]